MILFSLGLGGLIYRELHLRNPLVALRTLADRNFRICCIIIFCAYGVLYANTISLPGFAAVAFWLRRDHFGIGAVAVRNLRGRHAGYRRRTAVSRSRCPISDGRRVCSRWRSGTTGWRISISISVRGRWSGRGWWSSRGCRCCSRRLTWRRSSIYRRKSAAPPLDLLALLRNEGGSVGTSVAQIIQERREQFHTLRLNESLDPLNPAGQQSVDAGPGIFPAAQRRCCIVASNGGGRSRPVAELSRPRHWPTLTSSPFRLRSAWCWYFLSCSCVDR